MMNIVPFLLLILSLGVIVWFVVHKYAQLLLIDIDTLPHIQQTRKKDALIRKRAEKESVHLYVNLKKALRPVIQIGKNIQLAFRKFVGNIERKAAEEEAQYSKPVTKEERREKKQSSKQLVQEARTDIHQEDLETAEKKFLAAIKQDPKNKHAYKGLADVYEKQGNMTEAKETYQFVLQIDKDDEEVYLRLGSIAENEVKIEDAVEYYEQAVMINPNNPQRFVKIYDLLTQIGQHETALEAIRQALALEPQSPKYLDNFLETSIILGRKDLAEDGYTQLRMINPENQKLVSFRQRIDDMK